eukprot:CAMPEP_0206584490 /NCGR_PEP_ID=MMETSP0325_2-20121206/35759_1 /ASSEMBLY_ACC=CAM_ASM_000347 /TAXON_ID=2866 /ORGANISM="Crypthecodinium cohnii, Strain Seligo" /LENGTH=71 /DNA_ID=CAMNT_0054091669 /DNA_START=145 /DNA_END=360 /DNA_ORIENTATION=+
MAKKCKPSMSSETGEGTLIEKEGKLEPTITFARFWTLCSLWAGLSLEVDDEISAARAMSDQEERPLADTPF